MNKLENIEVIRRACVAANPEIKTRKEITSKYGDYDVEDDIRLADILFTLSERDYLFCVNASGLLYREDDGPIRPFVYYNLRKDSLTDQSDETLQFLADLLKDTK